MTDIEKLINICFHEFCSIAGDSPCGCGACPYGNYDTENGDCYKEYKKNKLKNLEQGERRWIPVTERLPEQMQRVIVCREDGAVEQGYRNVDDWWKVYGARTKKITHWMPLPQPPEEIDHG